MSLLSICIPTYNRVNSLIEQVNCLIPQIQSGQDNIELVISNNCSTDCTSEYLNQLSLDYPWIVINNNTTNIGGISNFKKLIEIATGQFIWLLGDDDAISSDAVSKIMNVLYENEDVAHVFVNYSIYNGKKLLKEKVYEGKSGYYEDGISLFTDVTNKCGLGALMFISANIYKRDRLRECSKILSEYQEDHNRAFSLAGSLYCSSGNGYIISDVIIKDQIEGISWSDASVKVPCRDVIAACDVISKEMGINSLINDLVVNHLPQPYPAVRYMLFNKDKRYDNYALKWMYKNYRLYLFKDFILFPFWASGVILAKMKRMIKGEE